MRMGRAMDSRLFIVALAPTLFAAQLGDDAHGGASASPMSRGAASHVRPSLGTAEAFALLGASRVTNHGPSTIVGEVGVNPGTSISGMDASVHVHEADDLASQAQADALTAYEALAAAPCDTDLSRHDLATAVLSPGVYCVDDSLTLAGRVTLDAGPNDEAVFVLQVPGRLVAQDGAGLRVLGSGRVQVFVQVGESAFLGNETELAATLIARDSISLQSGTRVAHGRLIALEGAVTLESSDVWVRSP
jgi:hypothetical protein